MMVLATMAKRPSVTTTITIVTHLDGGDNSARWRLASDNNRQWLVQRRGRLHWYTRVYCGTKVGLLETAIPWLRIPLTPAAAGIIATLPARHPLKRPRSVPEGDTGVQGTHLPGTTDTPPRAS